VGTDPDPAARDLDAVHDAAPRPAADDRDADVDKTHGDDAGGGAEGDGAEPEEPGATNSNGVVAPTPRVRALRRSAAGAILSGIALGLRDVLEVERQEPAIMIETSGEPPRDLPVEADIESGPARNSVVKVRPWLLAEPADHGERPSGAKPPTTSVAAEESDAGRSVVPDRPRRSRAARTASTAGHRSRRR
jgi:hypothetical protein